MTTTTGEMNAIDHYSVEGEPGTWSTHRDPAAAEREARRHGLSGYWSVAYGWHQEQGTAIDKRWVPLTDRSTILPPAAD